MAPAARKPPSVVASTSATLPSAAMSMVRHLPAATGGAEASGIAVGAVVGDADGSTLAGSD
jgi:hypothetical protein